MAKTIDEIRTEAAQYYNGSDGFDNNARKNAYECDECGSYIVTVDREPGVTPFMVSCGNCGSMAKSKFYRVQAYLEPTHEWYRPDTLKGLEHWALHHVESGGLLLRQIGGGDEKTGWLRPDTAMAQRKRDIEAMEQFQKMKQWEADARDNLAAYKANIKHREPVEPQVKREDYPSRQAYRHAVSQLRKRRPA